MLSPPYRMRMHSNHWFIYALTDPRTSDVRYVGVTTTTVAIRLRRHLNEANRNSPGHKNNWIRQLQALGLRPQTSILQEGDGPGWIAAEQHWIAHFWQAGAKLTNLAKGGEAPFGCKRSDETRAKMREIGKNRDPEKMRKFIEAGRLAQIGRKKSPEEIEKCASFHRGRKRSPAMYAKVAAIKRKIDDVGIRQIQSSSEPTSVLAVRYGVSTSTIWQIRTGRTNISARILQEKTK